MWKLARLTLSLTLAAMCLLASAAPALALDINLTFNVSGSLSVYDFGANTNSFTSAVAYAAQQFENVITDPITVNITVNGSSGTSTFGASGTTVEEYYTYSQVLNALVANATQPAQLISVLNLPANDPSPGGPNSWVVPTAEAKALGLISASGTGSDGAVTFGAVNPWTFDPNNRAVPGKYDFIGVAEHELSEAMGRTWGLGGNFGNGKPSYEPYDLFRFDGGTTTRDMTNNTNLWFSINGGYTDLNSFNYAFKNSSGTDTEDPDDWGIGVANQNYQNSLTNDAFNAYSAGGVVNGLSSADLTVFNVMGFHLSAAAMSGGTWARNGSGSWNNAGNWTYAGVPTGGTTTVYFAGVPANPSAPITVTLDGNQSAGALVFNVSEFIDGYLLAQGSGGTLSLGTASGGSITVVAGNHEISAPVTLEGPLTVNVAANYGLFVSGALSEANAGASLTFNGPGTLILAGSNGYTGTTLIAGGVLNLANANALAGGGNIEFAGGTLQYSASNTRDYSSRIFISSAPVQIDTNGQNVTFASGLSDFILDGLVKDGAGKLTLAAVNDYLGGTTINDGVLQAGNNAALGAGTTSLTVDSGTLDVHGYSVNVGAIGGGGTIDNLSGDGTLTIGNGNASSVFSGAMQNSSGQLSLVKVGSGTITITGNITLSGSVTVHDGTLAQTAGSVQVPAFTVDSGGSYNLGGGVLACLGNQYVGDAGMGNFTQSGGVFNAGNLYLAYRPGSNASYNLNGTGVLSIPTNAILTVGNSGAATFTQSGGAVNMAANALLIVGYNPGSSGAYFLNAGAIENLGSEEIGEFAAGSLSQTGGINTAYDLYVGSSASGGAYTLSAQGVLTTSGSEFIGAFGPGNFTQSGGTHNAGSIYLGYGSSTASATYTLSGGAINSASQYVGNFGQGYFTQSGGVNNAGLLTLGRYNGSSGTYALNGGTLSCSQITGGQGASTFYFNGGVLIPSASSGNFMSGLTAAYVEYNGALINTNGQNITIAQPLLNGSGGGSLEKSGAGALTLTAANTFTNGAILYGGTLVAANASGSALGSGPLLPEGGVLAAGPAGGTLQGSVMGGGYATYTIAPGADLAAGQYTTLNLLGGLTTNVYTTLKYNLNLSTSISTSSVNDRPIYGGDLVNLGGSTLTVSGGDNQGGQITFAVNPTQPGDYRLFYDAGGNPNLSAFNLPSQSGMAYVLSTAVDSPYIDLIAAAAGVGASGGTWTSPTTGSWTTGANWSTNPQIPSSGTVYFPAAIRTVFVDLDGGQSAGALAFGATSANGYTLQQGSGGALTLGTSAGATITVTGGAQNISAPLVLQGNLTANVASGASMQLSGAVSESTSGLGLTLNGPGLLIFSGTGAYSGNTTVNSGTLQINAGGALPANNEYIGTGGAAAYVVQNGGSNTVPNGGNLQGLIVGYGGGNAYYNLNGGLLNAANEFISWSGYSVFTQTGGTNQAGYLSVGTYYNGNYYLSGGLLSANVEDINDSALNGAFTQSGGTNQVATRLTIGYLGGGAYYLSGNGQLSAANEYVGAATSGYFYQTGGTNAVGANLYVGLDQSRYGSTYVLAGSGLLTAPNEYVGYLGTGTFTQTGGTNSVPGGNLYLGYYPGGSGTYNLSGGVLDPVNEYVGGGGTGIFYQIGGTNTVTNVSVSGGYFLLSGGQFQGTGGGTLGVVNGGFQVPGTVDLSQFPTVSAGTGALLDLSGNILNTSGASLSVGSDSLLIVPQGFDPSSYASYSNLGLTHTLNTTLSVSAGTGFGGWGTIADPVACQGTILATAGGWINLNNGLSLADPGQVNLGTGTVIVNDTNFSGMTGGSLTASLMVVGSNGTGSFPQSGGTSVLSSLYLGYNAADSGTYLLSGTAQLSVSYEYVGYAGSGEFTQSGGTHSVGTLYLTEQFGSAGTYNLNGGLLSLSTLYQGGGAAALNVGGGTFQAASPSLYVYMPITLSTPGNSGVFDTNGNILSLYGPLSGPGGLIVAGSGILTLGVSNSYTGTTLVSNGTLILGDSNALSGSTFDTSGTGALSFQAGFGGFAFGGLQGSGSLLLTDNSSTDIALTVGLNNADTTFSGSLSDSYSGATLTKVGTGTLTLTGTNTYGGGTFVEGGELVLTNNEAVLDSSNVAVGDPTLLSMFGGVDPAARFGEVRAVPEPSSLALLTAAVCGAAVYHRLRPRRKRQ